ncbi:N-acetyltransferase [Gordonia sp. HY285]|uniref:N-acetyltransferase n=1 Tax=Gordonia liuliyuniae TaxID=2911517 RepID=A0ABS9IQC6_9ACTN|nr:GNAT family N-acetyltransferase [Gordonia liuliyuniae]MCF8587762.1 N-acetyltransferase [Gordonia liuliyuniae]MCF8610466.1 N-acetyltransferase [Gordonia liuliyuniae]
MSETTEQVAVARNDEAGRYEITVDGKLAGFTEFVDRDRQRIFPHTELDDEFSGRGLSSTLVRDALADTRAAGQRVVAVCPLVAHYVDKHADEVGDIVDKPTPEIFAFLKSR